MSSGKHREKSRAKGWFVCSPHPEAEVVVTPSPAEVLHGAGGGGVPDVVVPANEHQRDGGVRPLQGLLQVPLLAFLELRS